MRPLTIAYAIAAAFLACPVLAHHGAVSNTLLYQSELVEFQGEIVDVFWRNPHARARLRVVSDAGEETLWELELGPNPRRFENMGIESHHLLGSVRVAGHVSRRDPQSLGVLNILMPDGREFVQGRGNELRWSGEQLVEQPERIDPSMATADERVAEGIFRTWDNPMGSSYIAALQAAAYTERGTELRAAYDPPTDNRQLHCQHGMPDTMFDPRPMRIARDGDDIRIDLVQYDIRRVIHMREAGQEPESSNVGYSVGRWDGDALVVATTGVDWPYYTDYGTPQSDQVRYDERFEVVEEGGEPVLHYSITITDSVIFSEPMHLGFTRAPLPGYEFRPYDCVPEWEDLP